MTIPVAAAYGLQTDKTAEIKHEIHFTEEGFYKSLPETVTKNLKTHKKSPSVFITEGDISWS